ncbi:hypothetical protein E2C01_066171 [Portunus trituberculatus]|uniref:Uncharacterized protein n=1 Tax=Portunus trituberculatus TaxID=210409 RepID=A0A5B7HGD7_PORTR|nr:hypothetical protein [Portunus trituberculatus]
MPGKENKALPPLRKRYSNRKHESSRSEHSVRATEQSAHLVKAWLAGTEAGENTGESGEDIEMLLQETLQNNHFTELY